MSRPLRLDVPRALQVGWGLRAKVGNALGQHGGIMLARSLVATYADLLLTAVAEVEAHRRAVDEVRLSYHGDPRAALVNELCVKIVNETERQLAARRPEGT